MEVARLVAQNERTRQAWAHPHNKRFYKPASFQGFSVRDGGGREDTPGEDEMISNGHAQDTEPELRLYLNKRPKDMSKGWVFGSDPDACDIYCGEPSKSEQYNIGRQTFSIMINQQSQVVLKHLNNINRTLVSYEKQHAGDRQQFLWIMFPNCKISVTSAKKLKFEIIVMDPEKLRGPNRPLHEQVRSQFAKDAEKLMLSMPYLSVGSGPTKPNSSLVNTPKTQPFYYVRKDRLLGSGSFGKVYIVVDVSTGVEYAGKTFFGAVDRREADILAKQNHVNILRYVTLSDEAKPLLVTEYIKEGNLARPWMVEDISPWQVDQIVRILTQALRGLASLHAGPNPVVHRDIKPENILVEDYACGSASNESGPWIKLADFGLARQGSKCHGRAGTWLYTAPEVFHRVKYNSKVDIWSLGVVILQLLLEGKVPAASGHHMEGEKWCRDVFNIAKQNADASLKRDRRELSENEHSLRSYMWVFVRNFMLQGDQRMRLSAQECLSEPLFLEMQSASRYEEGWRSIEGPTFDANGEFIYAPINMTKKYPPKVRSPLPNISNGALTYAEYDPGVELGAALEAQASKKGKNAEASRRRQSETPKPVAFGLVFGDPDEDAYWDPWVGGS